MGALPELVDRWRDHPDRDARCGVWIGPGKRLATDAEAVAGVELMPGARDLDLDATFDDIADLLGGAGHGLGKD